MKRVFRRGVLLFAIGIFYSGGFTNPWPDMRLMGVLNRIALAYFFAGLLFCFFKPRALVAICVGILAGYWALMTFMPIRDIQLTKSNLAQLAEQAGDDTDRRAVQRQSAIPPPSRTARRGRRRRRCSMRPPTASRGKFDQGLNLANHIDFQYLPGRKYDTFFDPEGFLSTLPAVVTCLLGVFAGLLLRNPALPDKQKVVWLICVRHRGRRAGLAVGFPIPGHQEDLDLVLCAGGRRLQRHPAGRLLSDRGCLESPGLVPAVCVDGNELDHDLPGQQHPRRLPQARRALRRAAM